jgi:two-component system phosphate regulon response regulator PhoB
MVNVAATAGAAESPPSPHLLVVEDDDTIRETISEALELEGFRVTACANGRDALKQLQKQAPTNAVPEEPGTNGAANTIDLVVLDLMLPGLGGLELCRSLREARQAVPILIVSARDSETDRVLGLEVGADDYLTKPFGILELVARCRALLRRSRLQEQQSRASAAPVLEHHDLCLYREECRVTLAGEPLNLSPKEYRLLELFMQHRKRVWSRDKLLEKIWGHDYIGDSKTVDVHIRWLREKIERNPSAPEHLVTVRGFGYRFG